MDRGCTPAVNGSPSRGGRHYASVNRALPSTTSGCSMNFCHGVRVNETAMKAEATMLLSNVTPRSSPNKVDKRNRMQLQEEIDEDSTGNTSSGVEMYAPSVLIRR